MLLKGSETSAAHKSSITGERMGSIEAIASWPVIHMAMTKVKKKYSVDDE